jgi:tRNA(Ile2) C34 agmatinyltransferase TiaS
MKPVTKTITNTDNCKCYDCGLRPEFIYALGFSDLRCEECHSDMLSERDNYDQMMDGLPQSWDGR